MKFLDQDSIIALVLRSQQGDREAFGMLYSLYYQRVYYSALRMVKNEVVAEDVLQTVFIHVLEHIEELKEPKVFESWLYRITYNACIDVVSQSTPVALEWPQMMELVDPDPEVNPHDSFLNECRNDLLLNAIDTLSEDHQTVIIMKYFSGMKVQDIAAVLDISVGTVKSRLSYGRRYLKKKLKKNRDLGLLVALPLADALKADCLAHTLSPQHAQSTLQQISKPDAKLSQVRVKSKERIWPQVVLITGLTIALALSIGFAFREMTHTAPQSTQTPPPSATAPTAPTAGALPKVTSYTVSGNVVTLTLVSSTAAIDPASLKATAASGSVPLSFDAATGTVTLPFEKDAYTFTFADTEGNWQTVRIEGKEVEGPVN